MRAAAPTTTITHSGWQAQLRLGFIQRATRTVLSERQHYGPLQVMRPFYPEGGVCHVYILHPPGGVVGGDRLTIAVTLHPHTHALITTPAAGKFYRSAGLKAVQQQQLQVAAGALLEWLPQENIVYEGARLDTVTRVELADDARFIGWDILCLGRPAAGEGFNTGEVRPHLEIRRAAQPLYLERAHYTGGSPVLAAPWGLAGQPVIGTLLAVGAPADAVPAVRAVLSEAAAETVAAVSDCDGVLVCRYRGPSAEQARRLFIRIWQVLRPLLADRPACAPRIWNT